MSFLARANYVVQRVGRNLLPDAVAAWARRAFGIVPGPETCWPDETAERYLRTASEAGWPLAGKRVMIFGSGPSFGVGCRLLRAGAAGVVLYDKFARPDDRLNGPLVDEYGDLVGRVDGGRVAPVSERLVVVEPTEDDDETVFPEVDVILSSSVLEHVADVHRWAPRLARATAPDGVNLHLIDLRDHFFSTPFEMLCYRATTWATWLDPRSHLNRMRIPDYEDDFRPCFERVSIEPTAHDFDAFEKTKHRIRPHFLTGDPELDAATIALLRAEGPIAER